MVALSDNKIPNMDLFVTVANKSFHVVELFRIRQKDTIFSWHSLSIRFQNIEKVSIKETLAGSLLLSPAVSPRGRPQYQYFLP